MSLPCDHKIKYNTNLETHKPLAGRKKSTSYKVASKLASYKCPYCKHWHIGKDQSDVQHVKKERKWVK